MSNYSEQIKSFGDGYLLKSRNNNRFFYKLFMSIFWFAMIFAIPCLIYGIYYYFDAVVNDYENKFSILGLSLFFLAGAGCFRFLAKVSRDGVREINVELARRGLEQYVEEDSQRDSKSAFKWGVILLIAVIIVGVIAGLSGNSGGGSSGDVCTICGKKATRTFQGSDYCKKHYNDAFFWAIDHVD